MSGLIPTPDHVIETLLWECRFHDQRVAQALQRRLGEFIHGPARQTMSALFEHISPPDEVWRIERLEIDLGVLVSDASPEQWADQLAEQLWTCLLKQRQALNGDAWPSALAPDGLVRAPVSAARHDLDLFLFYLQNGHLPWSAHAMAERDLADWLVRLAARTGPALWQLLQDLHPTQYVLERLSRIAPHQGLQALIALRHRELGDSLLLLDTTLLQPLLARSRLSAYQMQQLQQAWRVAALHALWGRQSGVLSAARLQRLIESLADTLAKQLGPGWRGLLLGMGGHRREGDRKPQSELAHLLLESLTGKARRADRAAGIVLPVRPISPSAPTSDLIASPLQRMTSQRLQALALSKLDAALSGSQSLPVGSLLPLLEVLSVRSPEALQAHLQYHVLQRASRREWLGLLGPQTVWLLMLQLSAARRPHAADKEEPAARLAPAQAEAWSESLRQFALAGVQQAAWQGSSVSALQTWLMDYTLRQLALGHPMPQDHIAWQHLWQQAMAELAQDKAEGDGPAAQTVATSHAADEDRTDMGHETAVVRGDAAAAWQEEAHSAVQPLAEKGLAARDEQAIDRPGGSVEQALAALERLIALPPRQWGPVQRLQALQLLASPQVCDACLQRWPEPRRWQLMQRQFPAEVAELQRQSTLLAQAGARLQTEQAADRQQHWRFLLTHCFVEGLPCSPDLLARRYAMHLRRQALADNGRRTSPFGRWLSRLAVVLEAIEDELAQAETKGGWLSKPMAILRAMRRTLTRAPSAAERLEADAPAAMTPASLPWQGDGDRRSAALDETKDGVAEPIWVGNAGVVILASYCQRLFGMLGLLQEGQFTDEQAQIRAVHALAYLCSGHGEGYEADWVLHKLFCGIPLQRPVPPCAGLDEPTQAMLDGLLQAVIAHWKVLGKTSPAGLRETFLCREGRLDTKADQQGWHWQLKVQSGPFDMLLDQLPWSFATIKLPWMKEVLYVDWR
ncbi:contractile injection system tape measure protein [Chitinimonas sp.]|uniref:contractile injection system tape measure protein n=1 Tax=Chitinimonas sp. TaxID=1934313 RepID=UPI002F934160